MHQQEFEISFPKAWGPASIPSTQEQVGSAKVANVNGGDYATRINTIPTTNSKEPKHHEEPFELLESIRTSADISCLPDSAADERDLTEKSEARIIMRCRRDLIRHAPQEASELSYNTWHIDTSDQMPAGMVLDPNEQGIIWQNDGLRAYGTELYLLGWAKTDVQSGARHEHRLFVPSDDVLLYVTEDAHNRFEDSLVISERSRIRYSFTPRYRAKAADYRKNAMNAHIRDTTIPVLQAMGLSALTISSEGMIITRSKELEIYPKQAMSADELKRCWQIHLRRKAMIEQMLEMDEQLLQVNQYAAAGKRLPKKKDRRSNFIGYDVDFFTFPAAKELQPSPELDKVTKSRESEQQRLSAEPAMRTADQRQHIITVTRTKKPGRPNIVLVEVDSVPKSIDVHHMHKRVTSAGPLFERTPTDPIPVPEMDRYAHVDCGMVLQSYKWTQKLSPGETIADEYLNQKISVYELFGSKTDPRQVAFFEMQRQNSVQIQQWLKNGVEHNDDCRSSLDTYVKNPAIPLSGTLSTLSNANSRHDSVTPKTPEMGKETFGMSDEMTRMKHRFSSPQSFAVLFNSNFRNCSAEHLGVI
jgi:hypothetical protein